MVCQCRPASCAICFTGSNWVRDSTQYALSGNATAGTTKTTDGNLKSDAPVEQITLTNLANGKAMNSTTAQTTSATGGRNVRQGAERNKKNIR